jgi:DNA-binding CsgD family transcriptional regulator
MTQSATGALALHAMSGRERRRVNNATVPLEDVIRVLDVDWHGRDAGVASPLDQLSQRFADAAAFLLRGWVITRSGEPEEVAAQLAAALDTVNDAGTRMLRHLGATQRPAAGPRRAVAGWDSLTPAEQRVAPLAAQGLTNPEIGELLFLSRRTVETHLSNIFGKLGIESRVQLAAAVARRNAGAQPGACRCHEH